MITLSKTSSPRRRILLAEMLGGEDPEAVSKVTSFSLPKTGEGSGGVDKFSVFNPLCISPNLGGETLFRALYLF